MSITVHFEGQTVTLPKIKEPVRFKHSVNVKSWYPTAELKNITISISPTGTYYASCLFEGEQDIKSVKKKKDLLPREREWGALSAGQGITAIRTGQ
jgi:hypothetical protein